jgi:hypothetical protein
MSETTRKIKSSEEANGRSKADERSEKRLSGSPEKVGRAFDSHGGMFRGSLTLAVSGIMIFSMSRCRRDQSS